MTIAKSINNELLQLIRKSFVQGVDTVSQGAADSTLTGESLAHSLLPQKSEEVSVPS